MIGSAVIFANATSLSLEETTRLLPCGVGTLIPPPGVERSFPPPRSAITHSGMIGVANKTKERAMKKILTIVAMVAIGAALSTASAEDAVAPNQKAPTKTMGDEGKLPATRTTKSAVPEMRTDRGTNAVQDDGSKRMGDEGKLPATAAGSNAVPDMTAPSK